MQALFELDDMSYGPPISVKVMMADVPVLFGEQGRREARRDPKLSSRRLQVVTGA